MRRHGEINSLADIEALEREPYETVFPDASPFGILARAAREYPDRPAIRYLASGRADQAVEIVSFADLHDQVIRAANLFRAAGVGADDAVGLLLPNMPEGHFALWGAEVAGRACPINHMLRTEHIVELLEAAGAKVLVALGPDPALDIWDRAQAVGKALPELRIFSVGGPDDFRHALSEQPSELAVTRDIGRNDIAACYHTGGTTGAPKLAQHTHGNQVHTSCSAALMYGLTPDDVLLNGFPLFHVAGSFVYGLAAFAAGASLLLPTRLGMRDEEFVRNYWSHVEQNRVTMLCCVPTVLAALMNVPAGTADISSLRVAMTGGSPLPTELASAFEKSVGLPVRNIFGMTECAGIVTIAPVGGPRVPGSTGLRLPFAEMKVVALGPEGPIPEKTCVTGETGVVMLKGPHVGPGYTDPSRNAGTFTEDGWLISGDVGHIDAEGQVFLTGRSKDVIIRGAHNIDPAAIEEAVDQHPAVEMSAAIGQPDAYAGELPIVFVCLKSGVRASAGEILDFARERIPERPAIPKRVEIIETMPLTAIGKIYKPALRARAVEQVFTDVLAGAGVEATVEAIEDGGRIVARIALGAGEEGAARSALRDFTIPYEISRA